VDSQNKITARAREISENAAIVQQSLESLAWGALCFVIVATILSRFLIIRPLNTINLTTERLAEGDMKPVSGFERSSDEIARIVGALTVFRNGLVKKEEMRKVTDQKRAKTKAKQTAAVDAVGTGLAQLAAGKLEYRISEQLTDGFAQLKEDLIAERKP